MFKIFAFFIAALLSTGLVSCSEPLGLHEKEFQKSKFHKTSIISQGFMHIYPGTNRLLNALYEKPDTLTIYENGQIVILTTVAKYDDQLGKMDYSSRAIYLLDTKTDSVYVLHTYASSFTRQANGKALLTKMISGASYNFQKLPGQQQEDFNEEKNCLTLTAKSKNTTKADNDASEVKVDTVRLFFDPTISNAKYSISSYYDSIGYGKVVKVEYKAKPFYSKIYRRNFEGFTFYDQLEYTNEVNDTADIRLIESVQSKFEAYKESGGKSKR